MNEPVPEAVIWAIFFLPLASFAAIAVTGRRLPRYASLLTVGTLAVAFALALFTLIEVISERGVPIGFATHELFSAGSLTVNVGARLDGLTAVMLVVVTGVSLMVQIYSIGYMHGDRGIARYFAFMSLFTAAMLGLVIADNLLLLFVFWELVGVTSYLLIGFWFHRPAAVAAAKKAFLVTRFGDLGLLAALLLIWQQTDTLNISEIIAIVIEGDLGDTTVTLFALGLAAGAIGKSAQFPLQTWLPDAMEGPTPVSGLVHSATMVAAGVYLLDRFFPVLEHSHFASDFVAWIGAV
ncbi:MAG: proton-conducting transporter membrane subunit, partial [Chloroflexi bacterium]|nr:proton-conducting transporter membrane subunit [Chloroflexota bacterium]